MTNVINDLTTQSTRVKTQTPTDNKASSSQQQSANKAPQDTLEFTPHGQKLAELENLIQSSPSVDAKKIAQIKASLADGTYTIDSASIADKIIAGQIKE